jgi:hypothetical protein
MAGVRSFSRLDFYLRWIAANGAGEALGLGTTFALGVLIAPSLGGDASVAGVLAGAAAAVILGTLLEGVVVGAFQAGALRGPLPGLSRRAWIVATAIGAGAAWLLGMIPSTLMALAGHGETVAAGPPVEPPMLMQLGLAALLGLVLGPVLALPQWRVLRPQVSHAGRWIWANALAWAAGMPVIFACMDLLPWESGGPRLYAGLVLVATVAGALVGSIHGRVLLGMLPRPG